MRDLAELNAQLFEQIYFLETSSKKFDAGKLHEAKRIANAIYTILHDKGRTVSILSQLGVKSKIKFLASGAKYQPAKDSKEFSYRSPPLLVMTFGQHGIEFGPSLGGGNKNHRKLDFDSWWNRDVIFSYQIERKHGFDEKTMSRKNLILSLTDQDGGRHLDEKLTNPNYRYMKDRHDFRNAETNRYVTMSTELNSARQIGWELVESIRQYEISEHIKISDPDLLAEIRDTGFCFFPSKRGFYDSPSLRGKLEPGRTYNVTVVVDQLTKGTITMVGNGVEASAISTSGTHTTRIVAGTENYTGIYAEFTDAIVKEFTFKLALEIKTNRLFG